VRHPLLRALVGVVAGVLAACGDSSGPGSHETFTAADPIGDTFGTQTVQPDLRAMTIVHDSGGIDVSLEFTAAVQSPVTGGANVVIGFVDFDTDQDSTTGSASAVDIFRPGSGSTGMGVEYEVDLFGYAADSTVPVIQESSGLPTGNVKPLFQGNRITFRVPRALLGNDDAFLNAASVIGSEAEPTDIVPNTGHLRVGGVAPTPPVGAAGRAAMRASVRRMWGRR